MTMTKQISLYKTEPTTAELVAAATAVGNTGILTRGAEVDRFEQSLERIIGIKYAVAVSNGTTALHLAVRALKWGKNDRIITSPISFVATTNVLLQEGCVPVFCEVGDNLQLDTREAYRIISNDPKIKGILIPHIFGHKVDNEGLARIKKDFPYIKIIEDDAQAFAPKGYGLGVGLVSDIITYSFHENKIISTAGEGGAVMTSSRRLAQDIRKMREQGRVECTDWLDRIELGYNYRMVDLQAHVGCAQLERVEEILNKRNIIAHYMSDLIKRSRLPVIVPDDAIGSWFGYYILTAAPQIAQMAEERLVRLGIKARAVPMPALTEFAHIKSSTHINFSLKADQLARRVLMLPLHTQMSFKDVERIVEGLEKALPKEVESHEFYDQLASSYASSRAERSKYLEAIDKYVIESILREGIEGGKILDVGCGDGVRGVKIAKATNLTLESIDTSQQMISLAKKINKDASVCNIGSSEFQPDEHKADVVLMLWNVLGHIPLEKRSASLKNTHDLLSEKGILIIDVNNQFNAAQYGKENAANNRSAVSVDDSTHTGNFIATREVEGKTISTVSHIFHVHEVQQLLEGAGFKCHISFVNYDTGLLTTEEAGQIFVIARRSKS